MRVLLVEDDDRIARDVGAALESAGYVVERERDGEVAPEILRARQTVLLDLRLLANLEERVAELGERTEANVVVDHPGDREARDRDRRGEQGEQGLRGDAGAPLHLQLNGTLANGTYLVRIILDNEELTAPLMISR
mgnify:CR=1 FL=1